MENKLQLLVITCIALAASPVLASNDLGAFNCCKLLALIKYNYSYLVGAVFS